MKSEESELTQIYIDRGVEPDTARAVAVQLMAKDALGAHAREELGISDITTAKPIQAAVASACSFAAGAIVPVGLALVSPQESVSYIVSGGSIILLAALGAIGAVAGRANIPRATMRVAFWGATAMGFHSGYRAFGRLPTLVDPIGTCVETEGLPHAVWSGEPSSRTDMRKPVQR